MTLGTHCVQRAVESEKDFIRTRWIQKEITSSGHKVSSLNNGRIGSVHPAVQRRGGGKGRSLSTGVKRENGAKFRNASAL